VKRRTFIAGVGSAAAWPVVARAQQPATVIGYLRAARPGLRSVDTIVAAFRAGLAETGYVEGRNVALEFRWAEGQIDRLPALAADLARRQVAMIIAGGSAAARAAKSATRTIPIVFAIAVDPLGTGMAASLARPGGNATGISVQSTELAGKRLEILREALPDLSRLAIIGDLDYPGSVLEISQVQAAARTFGIGIEVLEVRRAADIAPAFKALKSGAQALGHEDRRRKSSSLAKPIKGQTTPQL